MNTPDNCNTKGRVSFRLLIAIALGMLPALLWATEPAWWVARGVKPANPASVNDYAAINQGQLKNFATAAALECDSLGITGDFDDMVYNWRTPSNNTNDYAAVNLGQLKAVVKPFYDSLLANGFGGHPLESGTYPWINQGEVNDYAMANIGQVKNLFSFSFIKYYVSKSGADSNPGTKAEPWLTIAKAASTALPGDTVIIAAGTYEEYVSLTRSGMPGAPITFVGPATLRGFNITGDYIHLRNLTLDHDVGEFPAWNVMLNMNGNYSIVSRISFLMRGATACIRVGGNSNVLQYLNIDGNNISSFVHPAEMVAINGDNNLFTKSLLHDGFDIDAFKLFGNANTISYNEITDLTNPNYNDQHPDIEHADFVQTFGDHGETATNMVIENNYVHDCDIQIANLTSDKNHGGNIHDFTFRNNMFINITSSAFVGIQHTRFYNNLFYLTGTGQEQAIWMCCNPGFDIYDCRWSEIENNIFLLCGSINATGTIPATWGHIEHYAYKDPQNQIDWYAVLSTLTIDYNYYGGSPDPSGSTNFGSKTDIKVTGTHFINGGDPKFQSLDPLFLNFRLQSTSPLIDTGVTLNGFNTDRDGVTRPQGSGWEIGPYEYIPPP